MESRRTQITHYNSIDQLPLGFRFAPTDNEILSLFLINKVTDRQITLNPILDLNRIAFYSLHPKDLGPSSHERATHYFITEVGADFQNQTRREVEEIGVWFITEPKTEISDESDQHLGIGSKVGFTFFNKRGNNVTRTNWRMTEYHLPMHIYSQHNKWIVLAKITRGRAN